MGAETCKRCGRAVLQQLCVGKADGECGAWVSTMPEWRAECLLVAYTRQRARADAAERERDEARLLQQAAENNLANERKIIDGDKEAWRKQIRADRQRVTDAEATIATLREEVERLRRALRDALGWAGHDMNAKPQRHWIASETFTPDECPCAALSPPQASTTTQGGEGCPGWPACPKHDPQEPEGSSK